MEGSQGKGELGGALLGGFGVQAHDAAHHSHEGEEEDEHPAHAEDVEQHVGHGRTAGLRVGAEGGQVGGDGGANVLTHHQGDTLEDGDGARRAQHHGDGHEGGRALDNGREDGSDEEEQQDGSVVCLEAGEEIYHGRIAGEVQVRSRLLEHAQGEKEERQAEEEVSDIAVFSQLDEDDAHKESGPYHVGNVEGETGRHDPGAHGGADVGAHDDGDGLSQGEQRCIHEGYRHDGGCGGGLDGYGYEGTGEDAGEPVGGHGAQEVSQLGTRHFLERLAHHLHAVNEQGDGAEEFQSD